LEIPLSLRPEALASERPLLVKVDEDIFAALGEACVDFAEKYNLQYVEFDDPGGEREEQKEAYRSSLPLSLMTFS
jgi:hypothetical protein